MAKAINYYFYINQEGQVECSIEMRNGVFICKRECDSMQMIACIEVMQLTVDAMIKNSLPKPSINSKYQRGLN